VERPAQDLEFQRQRADKSAEEALRGSEPLIPSERDELNEWRQWRSMIEAHGMTAPIERGARPSPPPAEAQERYEAAVAQVLIELAFLLPRGTDLRVHPIGVKLLEMVRAQCAFMASPPPATPQETQHYESGNCPHCGAWVDFAQEHAIEALPVAPHGADTPQEKK